MKKTMLVGNCSVFLYTQWTRKLERSNSFTDDTNCLSDKVTSLIFFDLNVTYCTYFWKRNDHKFIRNSVKSTFLVKSLCIKNIRIIINHHNIRLQQCNTPFFDNNHNNNLLSDEIKITNSPITDCHWPCLKS